MITEELNTKRLKKVSFAYPTSSIASRYGVSEQGCYVVEILEDENDTAPTILYVHADKETALKSADNITNLEYSRYSLRAEG